MVGKLDQLLHVHSDIVFSAPIKIKINLTFWWTAPLIVKLKQIFLGLVSMEFLNFRTFNDKKIKIHHENPRCKSVQKSLFFH